MRKKAVLLACVAAALAAGAVNADDVWVKRPAVLRADRSAAGDTLLQLQQGDKAQQLEKQGNWVKVQLNGKTGWVTADTLSIREVKPNTGLFGTSDAKSNSAAAIKGLTPMAEQFAQNQHLSDAGINQMKQIKQGVTPQMLQAFKANGQLGGSTAAPAPSTPAAR